MEEHTNNGEKVTKFTGCWNCKYLEYYEKDSYESSAIEGWFCNWRDVDDFKDFPCKRKLKCFQINTQDTESEKEE